MIRYYVHGTIVSNEVSVGADEKASLLETMQDNQHLHDIDSLRSKAQTQLLALSSQIGIVEDIKILNDVRHYITLAINVIKVGTATSSKLTLTLSAKKEPVNKQETEVYTYTDKEANHHRKGRN